MKASGYNYYYLAGNHSNGSRKTLVWNTLTGALLHENADDIAALKEGRISDLPEHVHNRFIEKGILTALSRNELSELEDELEARAAGEHPEEGGFYRILTSTGCNAACPYCYEKAMPLRTMDEETAHQVARFIMEHQIERPPLIEWFGGEPLLNPDAITLVCRDLSAAEYRFASRITTNGSLWTEDLIGIAHDIWNLDSAQITIDGIGREHEEAKALPHGTFSRTIFSIHELLQSGIRVQIRVNHYEGQDHRELARWIADEFAHQQNLNAYATPGYSAGDEYEESLMREVHELNMIFSEAGLAYRHGWILPGRRHIGCFACDPYNFTIAPDGKLYNCSHNMSDAQCIGDVWSGMPALSERWFIRRRFAPKCRECVLLPMCMGGCRVAETGIAAMTQCPPFKNIIDDLISASIIHST